MKSAQGTSVFFVFFALLVANGCQTSQLTIEKDTQVDFPSTVYFLLTDRFNNGDQTNDLTLGRDKPTADYRGFMGGDIKGIQQKIESDYFSSLGVDAIWMTPLVQQISDLTDEGTGPTYGYHGYWARDWTAIDPNFGTSSDLESMVEAARAKNIKLIFDIVINHTGPVTEIDTQWPSEWVRMEPTCTHQDYNSSVLCTLVDNLPDVLTESENVVDLPEFLLEKWALEGRLEEELAELDAFFDRTGYPRAPKYYLIKWTVDWILDYGIDGFRIDTAKHTEPELWAILRKEADYAFEQWKKEHPEIPKSDQFFMMGEVYGYGLPNLNLYDIGDRKIDFFANGIDALINFDFRHAAERDLLATYDDYSDYLNTNELQGKTVVHYLTSHDDGNPFDRNREKPFETANALLLAPGMVQIYYGDETSRPINVQANGDASLRSFMNWEEVADDSKILNHWRKLGQFRSKHPSVAWGIHHTVSQEQPVIFTRQMSDNQDAVMVILGNVPEDLTVNVDAVFPGATKLKDFYTGREWPVESGMLTLSESMEGLVLLERAE
jgi:alpha-amylase